QRRVVDAFLAAARGGDLNALVALLDPDVVVRSDGGAAQPGATRVLRGAAAVARAALSGARAGATLVVRPAIVNGAAGAVLFEADRPVAVWGFPMAGAGPVEF